MNRPLVIELFCGRFGWSRGFVAEGFRAVGFDIVHESYHGPVPEHCELVLQDVLTLHGSQFRDAAAIVASPPCQAYSYMAMPWTLAKQKAAAIRADETGAMRRDLTALFDACFRIQREACEAAGRYIPMVVENVRGAQPWVGRAAWNYGSFYLWGDVPALMLTGRPPKKQEGDPSWFYDNYEGSARRFSSHSKERKEWSAKIAEIPFDLASHIARCFLPAKENAA